MSEKNIEVKGTGNEFEYLMFYLYVNVEYIQKKKGN